MAPFDYCCEINLDNSGKMGNSNKMGNSELQIHQLNQLTPPNLVEKYLTFGVWIILDTYV